MEVQINEFSSTVRAVDGDSLIGVETMNRIVRAVLQAVQDEQRHALRVREERRITCCVSHEQGDDD